MLTNMFAKLLGKKTDDKVIVWQNDDGNLENSFDEFIKDNIAEWDDKVLFGMIIALLGSQKFDLPGEAYASILARITHPELKLLDEREWQERTVLGCMPGGEFTK